MSYTFLRYPGGKTKAATFSYDDGNKNDLKLAEIFDKYGIKATFNFNAKDNFTKQEVREHFLSKGHEIACHGAKHLALGNVSYIEGIRDVLDSRVFLEELTDGIVRGLAYADSGIVFLGNLGKYEDIKNYLGELDIAYGRTLAGDNNSFELPADFHAWMPTAHHNNPKIYEWIDEFLALDVKKLSKTHQRPRLMYIWGHSYEFDRDNNWGHIEKICERLSGVKDVWFATNIEIYDYIEAYKSLKFSADRKTVYNPTLFTIWFDKDGVSYKIESGETIKI